MSQLPSNSLLSLANSLAAQPKQQGLDVATTVLGDGAPSKPGEGLGLFSASTALGLGGQATSVAV